MPNLVQINRSREVKTCPEIANATPYRTVTFPFVWIEFYPLALYDCMSYLQRYTFGHIVSLCCISRQSLGSVGCGAYNHQWPDSFVNSIRIVCCVCHESIHDPIVYLLHGHINCNSNGLCSGLNLIRAKGLRLQSDPIYFHIALRSFWCQFLIDDNHDGLYLYSLDLPLKIR
ncbi:hypothetical protein FGIG_10177 [Fasciola gigantica]|uniref:Uncharacterized protein n=1 Tax=Fasciola gigantica TaxID=46835 RepID=A0A504YZP2_FASGI|nr:hypothetical protein FGIG_10177 [Fasciola gigantica]